MDDSTVLKYPFAMGGNTTRLEAERKMVEIIGLKEFSDTRLTSSVP